MVNRLPPRSRAPAPAIEKTIEQSAPKPQRRPVVPPRFPPKSSPQKPKRSPLPPRFGVEIKALADAALARRARSDDSN